MKKGNLKVKQNLLQKIRESKASFVPTNEPQTKRFKYFSNVFGNIKRSANKLIQTPKLWILKIDWKQVRNDVTIFIVESFIEGLTLSYVTHKLLGWEFNLGMILAHGFLIKQGLDIWQRLKKDGPISKIPNKDK